MSSTAKSSPARSPKRGGKMTRAVVANLNRQRAAGHEGQHVPAHGAASGSDGTTPTASPFSSPARRLETSSPPKPLPPKPAALRKELPDVPEFFVVRPPPRSSSVKSERNDRRVFLNTGTLENIKISNGSVVLIQRHHAQKYLHPTKASSQSGLSSGYVSDDEEDDVERATVAIACPMSRIEPNGIKSITGDC